MVGGGDPPTTDANVETASAFPICNQVSGPAASSPCQNNVAPRPPPSRLKRSLSDARSLVEPVNADRKTSSDEPPVKYSMPRFAPAERATTALPEPLPNRPPKSSSAPRRVAALVRQSVSRAANAGVVLH